MPYKGQAEKGEGENYTWSTVPEEGGYYFFATVDLKKLNITPGESVGFLYRLGDHDGTPNIYQASWGMDGVMLIPHSETFVNWSDARTCLELKLEN